jgi:hypothetical protein
MKNSLLIWIPSIQNYLRFYELTMDQYRSILKVIDDKNRIEFFYQINVILQTNIVTPFNINDLTVLDRFLVMAFLKMNNCSPSINLGQPCSKCQTITKVDIKLDSLINELGTRIDRKFGLHVQQGDFQVLCDIPSIKTEYDIMEYALTNMNIDHGYIMTFIRKLTIFTQTIDFDALPLDKKSMLFSSLPASFIEQIQQQFIIPLHQSFEGIKLLDVPCQNSRCGERFSLDMEISEISDIIRLLFRDGSLTTHLYEFAFLSENHLSSDFLNQITPSEAGILIKRINDSRPKEDKNDNNMFESPSEFS